MADYGTPTEAMLPSLDGVLAYSFNVDPATVEKWRTRAGLEQVRVVHERDEVLTTLFRVPMGLWIGGRSVSNLGVAAVGAAPARRGEGHARRLMIDCLREARADGYAISSLYPATVALYRNVGYEIAGGHYRSRGPLDRLARRRSPATIRPATTEDHEEIRALHSSLARHQDGNLDRGDYVWARIDLPRFQTADGFVVEEDSKITGYTYFLRRVVDFPFHALDCTDLIASTVAAQDRLVDFFATHASMVREVSWPSGPLDPFVAQWPEARAQVELVSPYMVRICHVIDALEARGYRRDVRASLGIEVTDDELPDNSGRYTLSVEGGVGHAAQKATPGLTLNIRGLAALFSGYQSARTLRGMGWLDGDDDAIETAEHIFCARGPWMDHLF